MVELADAPSVDTYSGLLVAGETPEEALRRIEKSADYTNVLGSDEGQRLLAAATAQTKPARNGKAKAPATLAEAAPKLVERLTTPTAAAVQLLEIPLELIDVGENVRTDPGDLEELAANIAELGVLQPIRLIGPGPKGRYRAVWGQRRVLASAMAKKETIPALVEAAAEADKPGARRSIEQLAENLQRKDLNPIEEALAIRAVLDASKGLTQEGLAKNLGRSGAWLSNTLRLLDTAPEIQELVRTEKLTTAHAKAIAGLDVDLQADFGDKALKGKWSSSETERQAKYEKESAARIREDKAKAETYAAEAIATLEKVAQRDSATVAAGGYGIGERVAKLLRADGWTIVGDTYQIDTIKNAGSCGCKGVWRVNIPYGGAALTVNPACNDAAHKKAREAEREAGWKRDRAKADAERKAQAELERRQTSRLGEILAAEPLAPATLRLAIYAFATGETDEAVADLLGIDDDDEVLDNVAQDIDVAWTALEGLPDDQLAPTFAKAIALSLDDQWRVGQGAKDAIAALLAAHPAPEPEAPVKPTRAKKAAAS